MSEDELFVSVAEAKSLLVDFACLLHEQRAEIAELRAAKVADHRIMSLYPFDALDYRFQIKCQMDDPTLAFEVRRVSYNVQAYGNIANNLPIEERRLTRAQARAYDEELERVRDLAKTLQLAVLPLEEHAQSVYEVLLSLTILDCLTRQPFTVGRNWTSAERQSLNLGLSSWWYKTKELLRKVERRAEALSQN